MAVVGAQHECHSTQFVRGWADRFVPSPERLQLFDTIIDSLAHRLQGTAHIVELGIG